MYLTTVNRLKLERKQYSLLSEMSWLSKNLFNDTLYAVRQHYFNTNEF